MTNPNKGTKSTKEIDKNYPSTSGTTATTKHEGRQINLVAEDGSDVFDKEKVGLDG